MTTVMTTFTGRRVNPLDLQPDDVCLDDIAHHLATVNRFGGAAARPVSVAEHSVVVAALCPRILALQGLLHDASEAYLGDVVKWLKQSDAFAAYREAEERAQTVIYRKFGCPLVQHPAVTLADRVAVRYEAYFHMRPLDTPAEERSNYPLMSREEIAYVNRQIHERRAITSSGNEYSWRTAESDFLRAYRNYI